MKDKLERIEKEIIKLENEWEIALIIEALSFYSEMFPKMEEHTNKIIERISP